MKCLSFVEQNSKVRKKKSLKLFTLVTIERFLDVLLYYNTNNFRILDKQLDILDTNYELLLEYFV